MLFQGVRSLSRWRTVAARSWHQRGSGDFSPPAPPAPLLQSCRCILVFTRKLSADCGCALLGLGTAGNKIDALLSHGAGTAVSWDGRSTNQQSYATYQVVTSATEKNRAG